MIEKCNRCNSNKSCDKSEHERLLCIEHNILTFKSNALILKKMKQSDYKRKLRLVVGEYLVI